MKKLIADSAFGSECVASTVNKVLARSSVLFHYQGRSPWESPPCGCEFYSQLHKVPFFDMERSGNAHYSHP